MSKDPTSEYILSITRQRVASICLALGWNSANTSAMEVLQELLKRYIHKLGVDLHAKAELGNRNEPNILDLQYVFKTHGISIGDLSEYAEHFDSRTLITDPIPVIPAPAPKGTDLNFLKPGSREVLHRPVYVHEYLPPMFPELETGPDELHPETNEMILTGEVIPLQTSDTTPPPTKTETVREIGSVMMTSSGFISPARMGRLPDSRTAFSTGIIGQRLLDDDDLSVKPKLEDTRFSTSITSGGNTQTLKSEPGKPGLSGRKNRGGNLRAEKQLLREMKKQEKEEKKLEEKRKAKEARQLQKKNQKEAAVKAMAEAAQAAASAAAAAAQVMADQTGTGSDSEAERSSKKLSVFQIQKKQQSAKKIHKADEERSQYSMNLNNIFDNVIDNVIEREMENADREGRLETPSPQPPRHEARGDSSEPSPPRPRSPIVSPLAVTKGRKRKKKLEPSTPAIILDDYSPDHQGTLRSTKKPRQDLSPNESLAAVPVPVNNLIPPKQQFYGFNFGFDDAPVSTRPIDQPDSLEEKKDDGEKKKKKSSDADRRKKKSKKEKKEKHEKEKRDKEQKEKEKKKKKEKEKRRSVSPKLFEPEKPASMKFKLKDFKNEDEKSPKIVFKSMASDPTLGKVTEPTVYMESSSKYDRPHSSASVASNQEKIIRQSRSPDRERISKKSKKKDKDKKDDAHQKTMSRKDGKSSKRDRFSKFDRSPSVEEVEDEEEIAPSGFVVSETVGHYVDGDGNQVWICPNCARQDDGSPMIGCDTCDDWYHWLCVGITSEPAENTDWFCPRCIQQKSAHEKKSLSGKRGRTKK